MREDLKKNKKNSNNGDGSSQVNAGQINEISIQANYDEVDAINMRNNCKSGRPNSSCPKCNFCKKPGHIVNICGKKNGKPNDNQSASTQPLRQQQSNAKKYIYCGMKNHTTAKCFKICLTSSL